VEYLAFCSFFDPSKQKIALYGHRSVLHKAWDSVWSGGLSSIQGKTVGLNDYFDVHYLDDNEAFNWEGIQMTVVQTVHIMNGYAIVPSFGLMIKELSASPAPLIYYTSDTQFNPNQIKDFYKQADIIIQDCETSPFKSGVHAHLDELATLEEPIRKKMWLIHYQDNIESVAQKVKDNCFAGICQQGVAIE
jgi:hypothetical protein